MRSILCILICLCMASMASALSITNGNFENQTVSVSYDIANWWDYGGPSPLRYDQGPFYLGGGAQSFNGTKVACMTSPDASSSEDGGNHTYVYQSIGYYDGSPQVAEISLDWCLFPTKPAGEMGVTVMILESDGTFEPNQWNGADHDIFGFVKTDEDPDAPITEIGRGSVLRNATAGAVKHERFQIDLTNATIGRELFLRFNNFRKEGGTTVVPLLQIDKITLSPAYVLNESPEDGAVYVLTERTAATNDLVFNVLDASIIAVDVFLGPASDPNAYKLADHMPVTEGQYTINLESLPNDLAYSTTYNWKVFAYQSNGSGGYLLKYAGLVTSFTTIQEGPFLEGVTPDVQGVWPGENAVFSVPFHLKADTFQWFKQGNPTPLVNGAMYSGVDSNSLTVLDVQLVDEGTYYCVGRETATGLTASTLSPGELFVKELKAYYPFETFNTVSGNTYTPDTKGGKNMQLIGGASVVVNPSDPNTMFGGFLKLNNPRGVTPEQYAAIGDATVAHYPNITISCWVKPMILDLDYERNARIFDFGQVDPTGLNSNYFYLTLFRNTNEAFCEMIKDGDGRDTVAEGEIGYGTNWIYVVLTIEDTVDEEGEPTTLGRIYINGQYGGGEGLYHPSEIPKPLNYIGKAISTAEVYPNFDGVMDELKIYNYAKTAEEIAQEYMDVRTNVEFVCDMEDYDLADWDYNGDCQVSLSDLATFTEKWLQNYFIYPD